jgi:hypothetical protein
MKTQLRVYLHGLAAEIRALRRYRKKWQPRPYENEDGVVAYARHPQEVRLSEAWERQRDSARSASLALGFLRGWPYVAMERICYFPPDWDTVEDMVATYGGYYEAGQPVPGLLAWVNVGKEASTPEICKARRMLQAERGRARRLGYRAKYKLDESRETQAELKARLKAKFLGTQT